MYSLRAISICLVTCCLASFAVSAEEEKPVDFTRDIRPILTGRCFRCHGPDGETREAGLRLDVREDATAELESGERAIVPGEPTSSMLIERVASDEPYYRMPPEGTGQPLNADEIDLLTRWIASGAEYTRHWSFVKPERPSLPEVSDANWPSGGIDHFVLVRLEREGLSPSPEADRYTLIRRVSLDLTGLPPTVDEVDAFVNDESPDAYETLVDRLLASPAYGERWAQVWLDLARYADSQGYAQDPPRTIWRYRDWVIEAINRNMPFDRFTIEQLAGDLLENPTQDQRIATAFHRNTMTNSEGGTDDEEFRVAAVVDRVNTTMQVWMGITMGCAQCHTHKYDPITQEEYFQFFAVLNNTEDSDKGDERPTLKTYTPEQLKQRESIEAHLASLRKERSRLASKEPERPAAEKNAPLETRYVRIELPGKNKILSLAEVRAIRSGQNVALAGKASQISTDYDGAAALAIDGNTDGHYFDAQSTTHTKQGNNPWWEVDLGQSVEIDSLKVFNRTDSPGIGQRLDGFRIVLLDADRTPLFVRTIVKAPAESEAYEVPQSASELTPAQRKELTEYGGNGSPEQKKLEQEIAKLQKQLEGIRPVTTPIMQELPEGKRRKTHIMIRGDFLAKGEEVAPGVPAAFHSLPEGTGEPDRLAIARWLVAPENPLTARVVANRYWERLFGTGLVETSEDFGLQGMLPTHPDLLDFLAVELIKSGWDSKVLVRQIVTSSTYRQSSRTTPELIERDQDNRLLARGPRFRLSAEMIRDQSLAAAGLLSEKMYGASVKPPRPNLGLKAAFGGSTDWKTSPGEDRYRRGIYTFWRRTTPYPSMTTFDASSREVCTIRRIRTNTPLQALVTLNDPVYVEAAQALARRMVSEGGSTASDRIAWGFRICVARPPEDDELSRLVNLYEATLKYYQQDTEAAQKMATDPLGPAPEGMDAAELAALSVVGNVLMNLDEFLAPR